MSQIGLYVKFTAQPGQRDALAEHLLVAAQMVATAPGCQVYIINTAPTEPDVIWVTEVWDSQADHDAALTVAGAREQIARVLPLLAGRPEQIQLSPIGGKGLAVQD